MRQCFQHGYEISKSHSSISTFIAYFNNNGEKIILLYSSFIYFSSQCQKCFKISILWAETGSLTILFNSMTFKIVYGNSLYQLFGSARNLHFF